MPSLALACRLSAVSRASRRPFSPASLFSSGEQGVWYDPSDLTTLFEDSAGTTPITTPLEKPVGLMLDKSNGLVLGSELFTNTGKPFTTTTGWTAVKATLSVVSGKLRVTQTAGFYGGAYQAVNLVAGTTYFFSFSVGTGTGTVGYAEIFTSAPTSWDVGVAALSSTGSLYYTAPSTGTYYIGVGLRGDSAGGLYEDFSFVSFKAIAGNHASQPTATSRPVLSARVNLLTKTEQFDDVVWRKSESTAPNAYTLQDIATTFFHYVDRGNTLPFTSGVSYTFKVRLEKGTIGFAGIHIYDNMPRGCSVDLTTGQIGTPYGGATATSVADGTGWILTVTATAGATTSTGSAAIYMSTSNALAPYTGTGTGTILISKADLRVANDGVNLPSYQRVNTATDYDYAGFPPYLKFDGTDDGMATGNINFTATDKMSVFAGVRKLSASALGFAMAELSANVTTNSGSFLFTPETGGANAPGFYSRGTSGTYAEGSAALPPITQVLSGIGNISGDSAILRVNGTQAASSTADQGTGNYGNYPLYIGRRGGTSLPFNGRLYSLVVCGKLASAAEIASTENWVNGKTKAF